MWRLISCSRPCLFCLKIPNTFLLAKRKLTKTFGVTFEYKLPRGFTLHLRAIFDESRTYFDIFQRTTRLHRHCMCRVLCCKTPHGRRMKETSVAVGSWSSSIILTTFPVKEGPVSTTRIKAEKLKLPLLSAVVVGSRQNNQFFYHSLHKLFCGSLVLEPVTFNIWRVEYNLLNVELRPWNTSLNNKVFVV